MPISTATIALAKNVYFCFILIKNSHRQYMYSSCLGVCVFFCVCVCVYSICTCNVHNTFEILYSHSVNYSASVIKNKCTLRAEATSFTEIFGTLLQGLKTLRPRRNFVYHIHVYVTYGCTNFPET